MKTAIIYASNSGSTHLTAQTICETLHNAEPPANFDCILLQAKDVDIERLLQRELLLFGSPSWKVNGEEGQPHEDMQELLAKLADKDFTDKKVALFGCGDSSYLQFCGAVDMMESYFFKKEAEPTFKAKGVTPVIEPLKIDSYFFDIENNYQKTVEWANRLIKLL